MPALEERTAKLEWFAAAVYDELDFRWRERRRERVVEVGRKLLELVRAGEAEPDAFDGPQRDAVAEVIRASIDALRPEAVPMLARLAGRPVDHFFRGVCRVLVDVDQEELEQLCRLIRMAAKNLVGWCAHWHHDSALRSLFTPASGVIDLDSYNEDDGHGTRAQLLRWRPIRESQHVRVPEHSPLVPMLIAHRLGRAPDAFAGRVQGSPTTGLRIDGRVMTMRIAVVLDLQFVLNDERIALPPLTEPKA